MRLLLICLTAFLVACGHPSSGQPEPVAHPLGAVYPFAYPVSASGSDVTCTSGSPGVCTTVGLYGQPMQVTGGQRFVDFNSLVLGDIGNLRWEFNGQFPKYALNAATGPDGYLDATDANLDSAAAGEGLFSTPFTTPPNVTSITLSVPYKLPQSVTGTNDVGVEIWSSGFGSRLASAYAIPTSSWQTLSVSYSPTGNTQYAAVLATNTASTPAPTPGEQRVLFGRPSIAVTAASDSFWTSGFYRYSLFSASWQDNPYRAGVGLGGGLLQQHFEYMAEASSWSILTTAGAMVVEIYDTGTSNTDLHILINGRPFTDIPTSGSATIRNVKVTLPTTGLNLVTVLASPQGVNGVGLSGNTGQYPIAVYLPAQAYQKIPTPTPRRAQTDILVIDGTSKDSGFFMAFPDLQGYVQPLRDTGSFESIVNLSASGKSLNWEYQAGSSSITPGAETVIAASPTTFLFNQYRNDWGGQGANSPWGGVSGADETAWATQAQNMLTILHTALPQCQVWLVYTTHETSEGANNSGSTLANYYSGLDTLFTNNASWTLPPKKLDLRPLWASGSAASFTSDGIHPNEAGYAAITAAVRLALGR